MNLDLLSLLWFCFLMICSLLTHPCIQNRQIKDYRHVVDNKYKSWSKVSWIFHFFWNLESVLFVYLTCHLITFTYWNKFDICFLSLVGQQNNKHHILELLLSFAMFIRNIWHRNHPKDIWWLSFCFIFW